MEKPCVGDKINKLTIVELYTKFEHRQNNTYAKCLCDCGKTTCIKLTRIKRNDIQSCGCLRNEKARERTTKRNTKHGLRNHRLYRIWIGMKSRCNDPTTKKKGVSICDEWKDFQIFYEWSISHGYKENLIFGRVNRSGNYAPNNCRWTDWVTENRSHLNDHTYIIKITAFGETKTLTQWLKDTRCPLGSRETIYYRINAGWTPEDAISKPSKRSKQSTNKC